MGVITELAGIFAPRNLTSLPLVPRYLSGRATFQDGKYETYAREGYTTNALVFACIEELASSASEPDMQAKQAKKWIHHDDQTATAAGRFLSLFYGANKPNPFMDRAEFWRTVILHRSIAGNAYAWKQRSKSGRVVELWMLRPDRVSIVPDATKFISRYEYNVGDREPVHIPVEDIVHWKTSNPLSDYYGMPPLAPIAKSADIDNYALDFVAEYFDRAGIPAGMLTTKARMDDWLKKEIRERFSAEYGGRGKWHGLMVLDGADASYTPMTQSLGAQGLVLPELNKIVEARITGAFGVPPTLVGAVIGTEASSYGNKKSERESFWNETLKPLYRDLVGPLNRSLVPEYPGVQEVSFDLSTVGALQEDDDALHARLRADMVAGGITREEFRVATGWEAEVTEGTYYIPAHIVAVPATKADDTAPEPPAPLALPEAPIPEPATNGNGRR